MFLASMTGTPLPLIQQLCDCADRRLAGGKAANLGTLIRAGFSVPDGFVVTTALMPNEAEMELIAEAYRELRASVVAVRSSANFEDQANASMAGQYNTVLNIRNEAELLDAIRQCRVPTARAQAYLRRNNSDLSDAAIAVIVQRQVPADVAGVLFTASPFHAGEMLIEAGRGLGESIVSGQVQPDSFRVDATDGRLVEARSATGHEACLNNRDVEKLWTLGQRIAAHFNTPQDIEWAIHSGEIFLLQSRPITTLKATSMEAKLIDRTRKQLRGGPWVAHNLGETLPSPTPLTWSVVSRAMSAGFGAVYKRAGFKPSARVLRDGFLKLILGRPCMDLSLAPELFGERFPFAYDLEALRRNPDAAQSPPSLPQGSVWSRFTATRQLSKAQRKILRAGRDFDQKLEQEIIPQFVEWCRLEKQRDLSHLSTSEWITLWQQREHCIFDEFNVEVLFANLIAATAIADLRTFIAEHFWEEDPDAIAQLLSSNRAPNRTIRAGSELYECVRGNRKWTTWLAEHGHRALDEFDLAAPRWRETPDDLRAYASQLTRDPVQLHQQRAEQAHAKLAELLARMPRHKAQQLREKVELAERYLRFREDGKDLLMLGYDLLRDMALDASRRLHADAVWLTLDELCESLQASQAPTALIERRKFEHRVQKSISLPHIIDAAALEKLGEEPPTDLVAKDCYAGLPISCGTARGIVRIVHSPRAAGGLGHGYILVCSSTDPQWTPLFANAAGLVLERGGALSHGAIVAREMNIPAVVLPEAMKLLREGEHLSVDGSRGVVSREAGLEAIDNSRVSHEKLPPVVGARERFGIRVCCTGFLLWGAYLAAAFTLPAHFIYDPSLQLLDAALWPLVRTIGRPVTAMCVGAGIALMSAMVQKFCTDNARLREAKRRARELGLSIKTLPETSPRRHKLQSMIAGVSKRVAGAAFVPVGVLLGVFVMTFAWLESRLPAMNPEPGSAVRVIATLDADCHEPIELRVAKPLAIDDSATPMVQSLPPIRKTLEKLTPKLSDEQQKDLAGYLKAGIPPQRVTWIVRSEKDAVGRFPVSIEVGSHPAAVSRIAFGENVPPGFSSVSSNTALHTLKTESVAPARPRTFWKPFQWFGYNWDAGLLTAYLAGFLPAQLLLRWKLKLV